VGGRKAGAPVVAPSYRRQTGNTMKPASPANSAIRIVARRRLSQVEKESCFFPLPAITAWRGRARHTLQQAAERVRKGGVGG